MKYGTPKRDGHRGLAGEQRKRMTGSPVVLSARQRVCVEQAIVDTCAAIGWTLYAVNVRTNHVHVVVAGPKAPELILNTLKSWCTRRLRAAELVGSDVQPWSRHGSTVYLWNALDVEGACSYVLYAQDGRRD